MDNIRHGRLIQAVICDDVRREITGKSILIGVYSEDITVPALPSTLALHLWTQIRLENKEELQLGFRVRGASGEHLTQEMLGPLKPPGDERLANVVFGPIVFTVHTEGVIKFEWRLANLAWEEAAHLILKKGTVTPDGILVPTRATSGS